MAVIVQGLPLDLSHFWRQHVSHSTTKLLDIRSHVLPIEDSSIVPISGGGPKLVKMEGPN